MQYEYFFDGEEEFEPRITPKPVTKVDCLTVPTVPEISLIFENPTARKWNDGNNVNTSSAKSVKLVQLSDNTAERINSTSPILRNSNSYTAWREQNYSKKSNSANTVHIPPSYKNSNSCNHELQSGLQHASMQRQQSQDQICDMQKRTINVKANGGMYEKSVKFKCLNRNDPYDLEEETHLSLSNKKHVPYSSLQRTTYSITDHTTRVPNETSPNALQNTEHLQIPYTGYQQHHTSSSNCNVDNNETVKTLLQLVNSQSEQIKTLQLQINRLVKMQEESYRNNSTCMCSQPLANQVFRYPSINCYDTTLGSSIAQSRDQGMKKSVGSQSTSIIEKKDLGNHSENNNLETALVDQQSKKAFMEQKVSIGVMTSFEFTVQNSPFMVDSEICEKNETHRDSNNVNRRNVVNIHDTTEPVKRYKNTLTRKPVAAQLENIVEDSESYLSSSRQQSSNFNASSVKDSERHSSKQSDLYNAANTSESSKMYQRLATDLNKEKMHERIYIGKGNYIGEQDTRKMLSASMNVDCSPTRSLNCSKAVVVSEANDYTMINREKSTDRIDANRHPLHNMHLPASDYYQSHRNKDYGTNSKQIKDISDSMILSGGDLKVLERPPPTPEPSIHVEMQEYTSDDESDKFKRTSKIGWTFYNNVLGQVNEILQNSSIIDDKDQNDAKTTHKVEQENDTEARTALNTVKAATLEQLRRLGISLTEKNEHRDSNGNNKTLDFDSSFYPRLDCQANMIHTTSVVNETNTSMHMKALALKYLSDEQLADIALHKQESSSLKHLMVSNMQGTNMSFATMRYLERYQLLPGKNNVQTDDANCMRDEIASKHEFKPATGKNNPALGRFPFVRTPGTTCPSRILDLSTLKRQPKLL